MLLTSEDEMRDDRAGNRTPLLQWIALFAICWKHGHFEVNGDSDNWHTVFALPCATPLRGAVVLLQEVNGDV